MARLKGLHGIGDPPGIPSGNEFPPLRSRRDLLFFGLFLGLLLFLFRDLVFTGNVLFARDVTIIEVPARRLGLELLKQGEFPFWTDAYGNGQPYLANPKSAVFYPSTLLYFILPFFAAYKLHILLHIIIGWVGLYYLGKALALSEEAAFLGATLFYFSGITLSCVEFYNHLAAISWMPWILLAVFRFKGGFWRPVIRLSWLWSLMLLAGTPFVPVITGMIAGIRSLVERKRRWRRLAVLAVSACVALLIAAIQLVPAADALKNSVRGEETNLRWALEPAQLVNFLFPDILGSDRAPGRFDFWGGFLFDKGYPLFFSFYMGAGFLVLLLLGLRKPFDIRHGTFLLCLPLFFVLALGSQIVFFHLWKNLPPFSVIRYPVKYMLGFVLALCMLVGFAFDGAFRAGRMKRGSAVRFLAGSAGLLGLYLLFKGPVVGWLSRLMVIREAADQAHLHRSLLHGLLLLLIFPAVILAGRLLHPGKRIILGWVFIAFLMTDLAVVNRHINPTLPAAFFEEPDFVRNKPRPLRIFRDDPISFYYQGQIESLAAFHDYMRQTCMPFTEIARGIHHPFGRDFYNLYDEGFMRTMSLLKGDYARRVKLLTAAGCEYHIGHHRVPGLPIEERRIHGYPIYFQTIGERRPSVWLAYESRRVTSSEARIEAFFQDDFDPFATALTDLKEPPISSSTEAGTGTVEILLDRQGHGEFRVTNPAPAILVFQGNYRRGWRARVDGEDTEMFAVNLTSRGLSLPAGEHRISVRYRPPGFTAGLIISVFGLVTLLAATGFHRYSASRSC